MTWIISKRHKYVFVHIPKTAGSSIASEKYGGVLYESLGKNDLYRGGHKTVSELKEIVGEQWNGYFKFCFVRNPWDRFVSLYFYFKGDVIGANYDNKINTKLGRKAYNCKTFKQFCKKYTTFESNRHFWPQSNWIYENGKLCIDFVGRLETINQDFKAICKKLDLPEVQLPHYLKTSHGDYRGYYDESSKRLVGEYYRKDIELFGYRFE